jgi:hypothetical protein
LGKEGALRKRLPGQAGRPNINSIQVREENTAKGEQDNVLAAMTITDNDDRTLDKTFRVPVVITANRLEV